MPVTCDFRGGTNFRSPLNYNHDAIDDARTRDTESVLLAHHGSIPAPPITRIPIEILGMIFSHSLNYDFPLDFESLAGLISPSSNADPEIFGQVCGHWRSAVLSMPLLWSTMYIYGPKKGHQARLSRWLQRSQQCPLTFQLTESWTTDPIVFHNILSQLISQVHRWEHIHIYVSTTAQHSLLGIPPGAASSLVSADLHLRNWDTTHADMMWRIFHSSKSLQQAEWEGLYLAGPPNHAPWAQLTRIFFHHPFTPSALLEVLYACERITELRVRSLVPGPSPGQLPHLILPHLRLWVMDSYCVNPGLVMDQLTLPSLSHLRVPEKYCTRPSLLRLLSRSRCRLRTFVLDDAQITEDKILAYLTLPELQTVVDLALRVPLTDNVVRFLTRRGPDQNGHTKAVGLLPQLHTLHIKDLGVPHSRLSDGIVAAMVNSRLAFDTQRGQSRLRYVEMGYMPNRERRFLCDFLWLVGIGRSDDGISVLLRAGSTSVSSALDAYVY